MTATAERPYALVAELTYRCPLRCVYCSNPVQYSDYEDRLSASDWVRVFGEAQSLGVLQVLLSGGEPLLRRDLEPIVAGAAKKGLYSNLITSAIPLTRQRLAQLKAAGLNAVQISIQAPDAKSCELSAGRPVFDQKFEAARWVKEVDLPLTINVVLHRGNIDAIEETVALAEELGADRLELANTQYLAWALLNREQLLPTREQIDEARKTARAAKVRLKGRMEILFVLPDYYSDRPKACMSGWGRRYMVISPDGRALPCHLAHTIDGMHFENVREQSLEQIWNYSEGFQAFRGQAWMAEPCASCERRTIDFGGCRCQAFHLGGKASIADPACSLSPAHSIVKSARLTSHERLTPEHLVYRQRYPTGSH